MTVSLLVNFNDGSGWFDASDLVRACPRTERACSEDLTHAVSQCNLTLKYDALFLSKLAVVRGDVDVQIEIDGVDYFTGRIPPSSSFESAGATVAGDADVADIELEVLDYSSRLERTITEADDIALENYAVCDPASPSTSLVHFLLDLCGITGGALAITQTISTTLDAFSVGSGTVGEVLEQLLNEYGYTYHFDRQGRIVLFEWLIDTPAPTVDLDETLIMASLKADRIEREYDGAKVTWFSFHTKSQARIYLADLPMDNNRYSGYAIQPGFLWPAEANTGETWLDYQDAGVAKQIENGSVVENKDFSQIVLTKNHTVDESFEAGITRETTVFQNKRARITYRDGAGVSKFLYWCFIDADVIYLGAENRVQKDTIVGASKIDSYEAAFIHDATNATRLACARADRFNTAAWRFSFRSETEVVPGTVGALSDPYSGLTSTVLITECQSDPDTGIYTIKGISIAATSVNSTTSHTALLATVPQTKEETPSQQIQNVPTYAEIIADGFDAGGGTTVPTVPTIQICEPVGFGTLRLKWDRQLDLTNFDRYEVQVSADAATWYALKFDGTDWKGTIGADTDWQVENLTHGKIPNGGTAEAPTGVLLYYQVRRVTKAAVASAWSASASATTLVVTTADIAANAITSGKISTAVLNTLIANILSYLQISDTLGWLSGNYVSPANGDQRAYMDKDELALDKHNGSTWVNYIKLGGSTAYNAYIEGAVGIGIASPVGKFNIYFSNADYTNTAGANSHALLTNPSAIGQSVLAFLINGTLRGKLRSDYTGNLNYVAVGANHIFFTGGDADIGSQRALISGSLDPCWMFISETGSGKPNVTLGAYYAKAANSPTLYLSSNIYYDGNAWVNPDTAKQSTLLLLGNRVWSFYSAAANGGLGPRAGYIVAGGVLQLYQDGTTTGWRTNTLHFSSGWTTTGVHATIGSGYPGVDAIGIMLGLPHVPWRQETDGGARIRFATDQAATHYWDVGCATYTGETSKDKMVIGHDGTVNLWLDTVDISTNHSIYIKNLWTIGVGTYSIGTASNYFNDVSAKSFTDRSAIWIENPATAYALIRGARNEMAMGFCAKVESRGQTRLKYSDFPKYIWDDALEVPEADELIDLVEVDTGSFAAQNVAAPKFKKGEKVLTKGMPTRLRVHADADGKKKLLIAAEGIDLSGIISIMLGAQQEIIRKLEALEAKV